MTAMPVPDGFTRVLSGARHEVYCNGKERLWVKRPQVDRSLATSLGRCPDCRCSAFAPAEGTRG